MSNCVRKVGLPSLDINSILKILLGLLIPSIKRPTIPLALIYAGVMTRPGLSANRLAARIIARKHEAGISQGTMINGEPPPDERMELIRAQETLSMLSNESIIRGACGPMSVTTVIPGFGPVQGITNNLGEIRATMT